jgi:hypothetical protein
MSDFICWFKQKVYCSIEADQKRMEEMFANVQTLGMSMGQPVPPGLFHTPQPPATTSVSLPCLFIALLV